MLYHEKFANQWDGFAAAFREEINAFPPESITLERVGDWYKANSFRWSSIAESEGILLANEKNEALKSSLLSAIEEYSFQEEVFDKKPGFLPGVFTAAAASIITGVLFRKFWHMGIWTIVAETIVFFLCAAFQYAASLDRYNRQQKEKVCEGYVRQLENYKEILLNICKENEKQ